MLTDNKHLIDEQPQKHDALCLLLLALYYIRVI